MGLWMIVQASDTTPLQPSVKCEEDLQQFGSHSGGSSHKKGGSPQTLGWTRMMKACSQIRQRFHVALYNYYWLGGVHQY